MRVMKNSKLRARRLRRNLTDAERRLWSILRGRRLDEFKFRRQQPLGHYIVDFICFERRLVIEVDGSHHQDRLDYDDERTRWLNSQGFEVLRLWNNQVLSDPDSVSEAILLKMRGCA